MLVNIYEDGKILRYTLATILYEQDEGVMIQWVIEDCEEALLFVKERESNGGGYFCEQYDYWYYPSRETKEFAQDHIDMGYPSSMFSHILGR